MVCQSHLCTFGVKSVLKILKASLPLKKMTKSFLSVSIVVLLKWRFGEVGICSLRWGVSREMPAAAGFFTECAGTNISQKTNEQFCEVGRTIYHLHHLQSKLNHFLVKSWQLGWVRVNDAAHGGAVLWPDHYLEGYCSLFLIMSFFNLKWLVKTEGHQPTQPSCSFLKVCFLL